MTTSAGGISGKVHINSMARNKRKHKLGTVILTLILVLVLTVWVVMSWYDNAVETSINPANSSRIKFDIESGETAWDIIENLDQKGLINSKYALYYYVKREEIEDKFRVGSYVLTPSMTPKEMVEKLINPQAAETWITLVEGWNNRQIAEYLSSEGFGSITEIVECMNNCSFDNKILSIKPDDQPREGFFFPDSYIVYRDSDIEEILGRLINTFEQKAGSELYDEAIRKGYDMYEVLIMASMLEKEVQSYEDMQIVAGILWKRLDEGIPLGVDATVRYGRGYWEGEITYDDLQMDSPYNTRRFRGLPPSPIANPSVNSIRAAINPVETSYYYYITTLDTGEVIYADTLDEHNQNVNRYLR